MNTSTQNLMWLSPSRLTAPLVNGQVQGKSLAVIAALLRQTPQVA